VVKEKKVLCERGILKSCVARHRWHHLLQQGKNPCRRGCYDDHDLYPVIPKTGYGGVPTYAFGTHADRGRGGQEDRAGEGPRPLSQLMM